MVASTPQAIALWEKLESADENYMRVSRRELAAPCGLEFADFEAADIGRGNFRNYVLVTTNVESSRNQRWAK